MHLLLALAFLPIFPLSLAVLVNVTIDDTYGDPLTGKNITYIPQDAWRHGPSCDQTVCPATSRISAAYAHNGTWHDGSSGRQSPDATSPLLASIHFFGSAVYVYCIIPDTKFLPNGLTDMTFLIDSQLAQSYQSEPSGTPSFQYNALVYSNQSLEHGNHTLTIQNGYIGERESLVLLDYIVYTYENGLRTLKPDSSKQKATSTNTTAATPVPDPTDGGSQTSNQSGKIVGGVLGSLGVVLLGLVAFLWNRQKKNTGESNYQSHHDTLPQKPLPPLPRPYFSALPSGGWAHRWRRRTTTTTASRLSFNPSIFARPVMAQRGTGSSIYPIRRPAHTTLPPPVTTALPLQPAPALPDSSYPLQPNRDRTPPRTPSPKLDFRNQPNNPLSILEWQKRTQQEANDVAPRLDISEADISSYYEFSSDNRDATTPPPRLPPRRFTVVNN